MALFQTRLDVENLARQRRRLDQRRQSPSGVQAVKKKKPPLLPLHLHASLSLSVSLSWLSFSSRHSLRSFSLSCCSLPHTRISPPASPVLTPTSCSHARRPRVPLLLWLYMSSKVQNGATENNSEHHWQADAGSTSNTGTFYQRSSRYRARSRKLARDLCVRSCFEHRVRQPIREFLLPQRSRRRVSLTSTVRNSRSCRTNELPAVDPLMK